MQGGNMHWKFRLNNVFRFTIACLICGSMIAGIYSPVIAEHYSKPLMLPSTWTVLPDGGLDYTVHTIFPVGTDVFVGGTFKQSAGGAVVNLNAIARLDTLTNTWNPLSNNGLVDEPLNLYPQVRSIAQVGDNLYISGHFIQTADLAIALDHMARYNLTTGTWFPLAAGAGIGVTAQNMLAVGTDIYMVGAFPECILRYDTTGGGSWHSLANNGLAGGGNSANDLVRYGTDLYVSGVFDTTGDGTTVINLGGMARYDLTTNSWSSLPNEGLSGFVEALEIIGDHLYAGGAFSSTNDGAITTLRNVAHYDISANAWYPLSHNGVNDAATIHELGSVGNMLYVGGGVFTRTNDGAVTNLNNIAQYDTLTGTWSAFPNNGVEDAGNQGVLAIVQSGPYLYVGGRFQSTDDLVIDPLANIARLGEDSGPTVVSMTPTGTTTSSVTDVTVRFDEDVKDLPGSATANDVTNPASYLLVRKGPNAAFDTLGCNTGLALDDIAVTIDPIAYSPATLTASLTVNGGTALVEDDYRLFVCATGTSKIMNYFDFVLNNGEVDYIGDFTVAGAAAHLPKTGFAPGYVTRLPAQPDGLTYTAYSNLELEIPSLGVSLPIVGVPRNGESWDVSWLNEQAGWLEGSDFPTWNGNSVLTAHVWNSNNLPGPFYQLKSLKYGDHIRIQAWGQVYTYEVRQNQLVGSRSMYRAMKNEDNAWVTLLTCEQYDDAVGNYDFIRMVRAVLVEVD
jgi:LPXTG-site transpeptidase (sortase) family protein